VQQAGPWDGDDAAAVVLHQLRRKKKKKERGLPLGGNDGVGDDGKVVAALLAFA
jgi:hypothetical protein